MLQSHVPDLAGELGSDFLRDRLRTRLTGYEMVREIRGMGMLSGIEFQAPSTLRLRTPFEAFRHIHAGVFGQVCRDAPLPRTRNTRSGLRQ
jgi:acetylornithine/succinyldiaminopimelate/putrescine aminotransferase